MDVTQLRDFLVAWCLRGSENAENTKAMNNA